MGHLTSASMLGHSPIRIMCDADCPQEEKRGGIEVTVAHEIVQLKNVPDLSEIPGAV